MVSIVRGNLLHRVRHLGVAVFLVLLALPAKAGDPAASSPAEAASEVLEEVVVTAQKRAQNLQDVPVPVTVLNPNTLAANDQNRLQDYFATVPGLTLSTIGSGQQTIAIRGITTDLYANPTVAVTLDDVPFGSSTYFGDAGVLYPDIDPSDLARIEVLRGPQGTLYGADSLGGLVKFVTLDPSTSELSGRIQMLGDDVEHGDAGYGVRGAVNVPITDTFAIRASAFARSDPGYIEDLTTGQADVNETEVYGGRVSALWRVSAAVSLKLSAMLQHSDSDANGGVNASSSLQLPNGALQVTGLPCTGGWYFDATLYTATLTATLAGLDFVSVSGYGSNKDFLCEDLTTAFGSSAQQLYGVTAASLCSPPLRTQKFTQEFRLSSPGDQLLEWMAGAFYTHEYTSFDARAEANDLATGAPVGLLLNTQLASTLVEYALFGDLTVHLTERFDLQLGGRESENRQTFNETDTGPFVTYGTTVPSIYVEPTERSTGNAFTYLVTPRIRISPDLMLYARLTSGYRLGGPNIEAQLGQVPLSFRPDKTNNYELGMKVELPDHTLTLDASAYYIDWRDIQVSLYNPINYFSYYTNGGTAKSQGLELSAQARPTQGLRLSAAASLGDAVLTQTLPPTSNDFGLAGDRLPYSSRFSGNLTADQDIVHAASMTGFIGASLDYVGLRLGAFQCCATQPRLQFPAYALINLHAGARYESWTVNLFVNNLADKRAILGTGPSYALGSTGTLAYVVQPRTVGLSVAKNFGSFE
jgi:iron complex outermembrane recepter protein